MAAHVDTEPRPVPLGRILGGTLIGGAFIMAMLVGGFGATIQPNMSVTGTYGPSPAAIAGIPTNYLRLYLKTGDRYGIDWAVLAGIGAMETDHGRSRAQGVRNGVNAYGCCAGPMQFSVVGHPSTWDTYGGGGDVYDPRDAIPAAARMLVANGAPGDYTRAILAYNHADWYVAGVLRNAAKYRGAMNDWPVGEMPVDATVTDILRNRNITLTATQRDDLRTPGIDGRIITLLAWIGESHAVIVTALRHDHSVNTVEGNRSNHADGRAIDLGAVDGVPCGGTISEPCSDLGRELVALHGVLRPTELIWCFDLDGPDDPRSFARADHCDHLHVGFDA